MSSFLRVGSLLGVTLVACSPASSPTRPSATASADASTGSPSTAIAAPPASASASGEAIAAEDVCTESFSWTKRPPKACLAQNGLELWAPAVSFRPSKESIEPGSFAGLDGVVTLVQRYPGLGRIRVEGHLGTADGEQYSRRLSDERAQSVRAYLISRGVSPERLVAVGFGALKPIADPKTEDGRKLNERIDFVVMAGLTH